jgi:hypothetical protein
MDSVTVLLIGVFVAGMALGGGALVWAWRKTRLRQKPPS